ncbi:MAG TPA: polyprenyl synthetase family protein [Thermomonospora sp.]|nr:polyprenyl synthetase family protein [Thermomonospora sp.]
MHDHEVFRSRVDAALEAFVARESAEVVTLDPCLGPVVDQLRQAVSGGKRVRAAFCYWGWRAAGQPDTDAVIRAAAAMELVHAAAIVHDDIIDDSAVRRGVPAAHVALRGPGRPSGGDRGTALAILVGDMLMTWAAHLFNTCGLPHSYVSRARSLWVTLARELIAGECMEILRPGARPEVDDALQIIRFKTAKYTVERPLHIGGTLAGASPGTLEAFTAYGVPLGEAFQLRDDLIGVFGDPGRTGKSNLDDLRGRKPTALLALTLTAVKDDDREELRHLLDGPGPADDDLRAVREIIERSGARDHVETMIAQRVRAALAALTRARLRPPATEALTLLASALTTRDS